MITFLSLWILIVIPAVSILRYLNGVWDFGESVKLAIILIPPSIFLWAVFQ